MPRDTNVVAALPFIEHENGLQIIATHYARKEKVGRHYEHRYLFFLPTFGKLLHQAFGGDMIGGATAEE